jgi:hypothetical protein
MNQREKETRTPRQLAHADAGKRFGRMSGQDELWLRSYLQLSGRVWQLSICPSGFLNVCTGPVLPPSVCRHGAVATRVNGRAKTIRRADQRACETERATKASAIISEPVGLGLSVPDQVAVADPFQKRRRRQLSQGRHDSFSRRTCCLHNLGIRYDSSWRSRFGQVSNVVPTRLA